MKSQRTNPLFLAVSASAGRSNGIDHENGASRTPPKWPRAVLFEKLAGSWEGTCRTWFEPGRPVDDSRIVGRIHPLVAEPFLRHVYSGSMQGKPRHGEETIAFNAITQVVQVSWLDDFGMSTALMFSTGRLTELGFSVRGEYDVAAKQPRWGWRTDYRLVDEDHLTITAFNITPTGTEAKAAEIVYARVRTPVPDQAP